MAIGVPGFVEYGGGLESVWCSLNGEAMVRLAIRRGDTPAILFTPNQAMELAKVLTELAGQCAGYRVADDDG